MSPDEFRAELEADRALSLGQHVTVRWGYGSGFRARGRGVIVRLSRLSVQVALTAPVLAPHACGGTPWPAGYVLTGIPRFGSERWHAEHGVVVTP